VPDLLRQIDGREVHDRTLHPAGATVEEIPMSIREQVFQVIWRPEVMFILMLVAIYGIIGELSNPGAILPGVVGAIALILALYMGSVLPVNIAGIALIVLALALFVTDVFAPSHGVLTVGGIVSFFLGYDARVAMASSNFAIPAGRLTAVIGPNGSGKSTLLNALAGLLEPRAGSISVLGHPPARVRRRVAYVLQATKVNEVMPITVRETVAMGRYALLGPFGFLRGPHRRAYLEAMERLEIADLAGRHLHELSGGQRQRVFVAQGLAQQAELLLLDEPITGLDLVSMERIRTVIAAEIALGTTVVMTTHDVADANRADHVILMSGRVHAEGPPAQALHPDRLSEAYGIALVHLEDGSVVLDDAHHRPAGERHVHFERGR